MKLSFPALIAALWTSGCSLVYDADVFVTEDAAPIDAEMPTIDADPAMLAVGSAQPAQVFEGEGCLPDGEGGCTEASRGIPIVVRGTNFIAGAEVTLSGAGLDGLAVTPVVSRKHNAIAFTLQLPVVTEREGAETLTITVSQAGFSDSTTLEVVYLPELTLDGEEPPESHYGELYSRIVIDDPDDEPIVLPAGDAPAQFWATAELVLADRLIANGAPGGQGGEGGPGGCDGGAPEQPGSCGDGGGGNGAATNSPVFAGGGGGAGGGLQGPGQPGQGGEDQGGDPGEETGDPMLSQIVYGSTQDGNRGNGGGGGSGSSGGRGGGGGGTVELTSGGILTIREQGAVEASGGRGENGVTCPATVGTARGDGGGGSGGVILVRAPVIDTDGAIAMPLVATGGDPGTETNGCNGGGGSDGRIRLDGGEVAADPSPERGPRIDPQPAAVVADGSVEVTVLGDGERDYGLRLNDSYVATVGGGRSTSISLEEGLNDLCAVATTNETLKKREALNCVTVAYIPQ